VVTLCTHSYTGATKSSLFVANIRRSTPAVQHLLVADVKGRIQYITSELADMLGGTPKSLLRTEFSRFIAQPFTQLHSKWMKVWPHTLATFA
jgi:PAS domain-containing protein